MDPLKPETAQEAKLHFLDYWRIIRIRKTVIIAVFLLVAITATVVTFILPESYASTTRMQVEPDINDIGGLTDTQSYASYDPYFIQTAFEIIQDQVVLAPVIEDLNLNVEWGKKYAGGETLKTSETMELLKKQMSLTAVRNTKLIEITVYDQDKNEAANIANHIAESYRAYRLGLRTAQALGGIKVLEDSFNQEAQEIESIQTNVDSLRTELNINDTDPNSITPTPTLTLDEIQHLEDLRIEKEAVYIGLEKQLAGLQTNTPDKLREILPTVIQQDSALTEGLNSLNEAQQKMASLTNDYSPANPEVMRVQSLIDELNHEIDARVNGIMAGLADNVRSQKAAVDSLAANVEDARKKDQEEFTRGQPYWEAKRKLEDKIEFHKLLAEKLDAEKVDLSLPKTAMVEITRTAEPGKDPVRPNKTLNIILGIIVGFVVGIGLAFFIEYLDTSVKTIDDVERALQLPVLGVIPQNVGPLIKDEAESHHAEAYRVLRTHIQFSRKDENLNTIAIVSAGAGEGKSTTTLNLATVFAQGGDRVLVVDSDLRRPTLHKILGLNNNLGLVSYLLKQNTLEEVIQRTSLPTLDFMASGKLPSSSMGILSSQQMRDLITELKRRYDYIFFDSPPILGVSDASILASEVDMAIQVIQYRRYPQPMNIRAKQLVQKVGGNLIGIVLNNINMSQDESYYYYSGYYYDYYYSHSDDKKEDAGKTSNSSAEAEIKQKY